MLTVGDEAFAEADDLVVLVIEGLVEFDNFYVGDTDLEIYFGAADRLEDLFCFLHYLPGITFSLERWRYSQVVDPAPMTFVTCHTGSNNLSIEYADEEPIGIDLQFSLDIEMRIILGNDQFAVMPELDDFGFITGIIGANIHINSSFFVHFFLHREWIRIICQIFCVTGMHFRYLRFTKIHHIKMLIIISLAGD